MRDIKQLVEEIKSQPYCDPNRRMDFVLFFDVKNGNPNGDPDAGNLPRVDPQTRHGFVTDVCIKRKIRDYLSAVLGRPIYIQSQAALNTLYFDAARKVQDYEAQADTKSKPEDKEQKQEAAESVKALMVELKPDDAAFNALIAVPEANRDSRPQGAAEEPATFRDWLADTEVDGLEFDAESGTLTFLGEAKSDKDFKELLSVGEEKLEFETQVTQLAKLLAKAKKQKKAGAKERDAREAVKAKMCELYDDIRLFGAVLTAGTNAGQIRGPMQLTFGRSTAEILPWDAAITRCAITKASDWLKKKTEFGRKPWLNYAAYRQHGYFNAMLGKQTGVTSDDLARFWVAVANMFQEAASASKGEMATQELVVFVHPNERGSAPSHKLLSRAVLKKVLEKQPTNEAEADLNEDCGMPDFSTRFIVEVEDKSPALKDNGIDVHRPLRAIWNGF